MNIKGIIDATIIGAKKEQKKERNLQHLSHEKHIGYYANQHYQYMRDCNPALPAIPELDRMADSQFSRTIAEVKEIMKAALDPGLSVG